jgi:hypothetical protein
MTKQHKTNRLINTLLYACRLKRPHGGKGVEALARYIERMFAGLTFRDGAGNVHLDLRQRDRAGKPIQRTLFVAHIDTVHRADGPNRVDVRDPNWLKASGDCLGADDAAGVAILCNLALYGVPAYYVFTQGEERGGIGARFLADRSALLLAQFDRAIAFDRRDVWSVISHQGWSGRCCSDAFAAALADRLNDAGLLYAPDDTGVYTDTAEFTFAVPECTNISVGYYSEHSKEERLDLNHFVALAKACRKLDWESLPTERDTAELFEPFMPTKKGKGKSKGKSKDKSRFASWDYTDYDLDLYDALDLAVQNRPDALLQMLAARMGHNEIDRSIARAMLAKRPMSRTLLESTMDMIDNNGGEIAADVLLEELVGGFH